MDGLHLLLIGVVVGLLAAMQVFGGTRTEVVISDRSSDEQKSGCGGIVVLLALASFIGFSLLVFSGH